MAFGLKEDSALLSADANKGKNHLYNKHLTLQYKKYRSLYFHIGGAI